MGGRRSWRLTGPKGHPQACCVMGEYGVADDQLTPRRLVNYPVAGTTRGQAMGGARQHPALPVRR